MKELPHSFPEGSEVSLCTACLPATLRAAVNPLAATPGCMHGCSEQNSSSEPDPDPDPAVTAETEQQPRRPLARTGQQMANLTDWFTATADGPFIAGQDQSGPGPGRPGSALSRQQETARSNLYQPLIQSITRVFNQHRFIGERLLLSASGSRARGHERWSQPL